MSQHDDSTIRIKTAAAQGAIVAPRKRSKKVIRRSIFPILGGLLLVIGVATVSGGAWYFFHSSSKIDDIDSIADIDGFEPVSETSAQQSRNESSRDHLGVPSPDDMETTSNAMIELPELPASLFPMTSSKASAEVWLTGTIEETDTAENTGTPLRLSGEPNEALILR